jgi:YHS domain-containing protein
MKTLLAFCLLMSAFSLKAQNTDYALEHYNLKDGLAIQGYDPVAYFTSNKAIKGQESIEYTFEKVTYRFSSEANKKLFVASPDKYKPAYGGYCAYAIAFGDKVKINPETFKVKDGKLFLFYNFRRTNTLTKWNKDEPNLYSKATKPGTDSP